MKMNYISKISTSSILTVIVMLVLLGFASRTNAQTLVVIDDSNPTCADINADNVNFPTITSDNGFSTGNAPKSGVSNYNISNVGSVTVTNNSSTDIRFSASSAFITAVIVKAASGANVYVYDPPTATGGPLETYIKNGKNAGLSHLVFCYDVSVGPTAATAMLGGRVQLDSGKLSGSVLVTILNTTTLETQVALTNRLGYYQFENLQIGQTYVISVSNRGYTFNPQVVSLDDDTALDMYGSYTGRSGSKDSRGTRNF